MVKRESFDAPDRLGKGLFCEIALPMENFRRLKS